jgi:Flp pilus assembly protein TadG
MRTPMAQRVLRRGRELAADAERGSALVEFTFLGVLLFVPLVYVVLAVFDVQRSAYGVDAAAREAGRAFTNASDDASGRAAAQAAATVALADQGVSIPDGGLRITCSLDPCLSPGGRVTVQVDTRVALPWSPSLGDRPAASVAVSGRSVAVVDSYRSGT